MNEKTKMNHDQFAEQLREMIGEQSSRDPVLVEEGKARFLTQAKLIQKSTVTQIPPQRHSKWNLSRLKEVKMGTIITLIVLLGLVLSGTTAVQASQNDLPGDPLYQVKLISEGVRLDLTMDPEEKMNLDLSFALRRVDEIEEMIELGLEPPEMSYARLENSLMHAVGQAALLEDDLPGALLRIRQTLQERIREVESETENPLQTRLRTTLQTRLSWLDEGIADPERFINEARIGWETAPNRGEASGPQTGIDEDEEKPGFEARPTEIPGMGPGVPTQTPGYLIPGGPGYGTGETGGQIPGEGNGNGNNSNKP